MKYFYTLPAFSHICNLFILKAIQYNICSWKHRGGEGLCTRFLGGRSLWISTSIIKMCIRDRVYVFIMGFAQIPQDLAKVYNGTIRSAGYRNAVS